MYKRYINSIIIIIIIIIISIIILVPVDKHKVNLHMQIIQYI